MKNPQPPQAIRQSPYNYAHNLTIFEDFQQITRTKTIRVDLELANLPGLQYSNSGDKRVKW